MEPPFTFAPTLSATQRSALEHLLYFNVNQERVRLGIQKSIERYGVPEIVERDGVLSVRVGTIPDVQTLFAISKFGNPIGVIVFARTEQKGTLVLHVGVLPRLRTKSDVDAPVLLELVHQVHQLARERPQERVEIAYSRIGTRSKGLPT